jgi:thioredoxin-like negative regulator of GroEL
VVAFHNHQAAAAVRYVQEAVDREPTNFYLRLTLAQLETLAGQTPAALATLATVRELRPAIDVQVTRAIQEISHLPGGHGG